jgi:hypothetical protein
MACWLPVSWTKACSSSAHFAPVVIQPESNTALTAASSSSPNEGRENGKKSMLKLLQIKPISCRALLIRHSAGKRIEIAIYRHQAMAFSTPHFPVLAFKVTGLLIQANV